MAWVFQGKTDIVAGSGGAVTVTKPAGVTTGDLIVVLAYLETNTNTWASVGSGFTAAESPYPTIASGFGLQLWWKVAGASEPASWTWTPTTTGVWREVSIAYYRGGTGTTGMVDVAGTVGSGTGVFAPASLAAPSVTTTAANDLLLFVFADFSGDNTASLVGAATNLRITNGGLTLGDATIASAGATGTTHVQGGGIGTETFVAFHVAFFLNGSGGSTTLSRTANQTVSLKTTLARTASQTASLKTTLTRTANQTARLKASPNRSAAQTATLAGKPSRTANQTASLKSTPVRSASETASLKSLLVRSAGQSAALIASGSRTASQSATLKSTPNRSAAQTVSLKTTLIRTANQAANLVVPSTTTRTASQTVTLGVFQRQLDGGTGYTDVTPRQIVRTRADYLYAFVSQYTAYPGPTTTDTLMVVKADQTGVPTSATSHAQSAITNVSAVAAALLPDDTIAVVYAQRTGNLTYRVWDTASDSWASAGVVAKSDVVTSTTDSLTGFTGQGSPPLAMAIDAGGHAHVVYLRSDGTRARIVYTTNSSGSWSANTSPDSGVTYTGNQKAWQPNIAFDSADRIIVAWNVGAFNGDANGTVYTAVNSSGSWANLTTHDSGTAHVGIDQSPSLYVDANDRIHLAWLFGGATEPAETMRYAYSDDHGATFTTNHPTSAATHDPSVGPGPNGSVRLWGHGPQDGTGHGNNITFIPGPGGSGSWGPRQTFDTNANVDSSVNVRWSQHNHVHPQYIDVAFWLDTYPNELYLGTEAVGSVGTRTANQTTSLTTAVSRTASQAARLKTTLSRTANQTAALKATLSRTANQAARLKTTLGRTANQTTALKTTLARVATQTVKLAGLPDRVANQTASLKTTAFRSANQAASLQQLHARTATQTASLQQLHARIAGQTASLKATSTRSAAQGVSLAGLPNRTAGQTVAIKTTLVRIAGQTAAIKATPSRTASQTVSLSSLANHVRTANQTARLTATPARTANHTVALQHVSARTAGQAASLQAVLARSASQHTSLSGAPQRTANQTATLAGLPQRTANQTAALKATAVRGANQAARLAVTLTRIAGQAGALSASPARTAVQTVKFSRMDNQRTANQTVTLTGNATVPFLELLAWERLYVELTAAETLYLELTGQEAV